MPTKHANDLADQDISDLNSEEIGDDLFEAGNVGLPDLPGKTQLGEDELNIATAPSLPDSPDSMTEAVMENLRVGVGATSAAKPREARE